MEKNACKMRKMVEAGALGGMDGARYAEISASRSGCHRRKPVNQK